MLIFKQITKLFSYVSFKFLVLILVVLFLINLILLYNLKFIGYVHNTAPILQSQRTLSDEEKKNTSVKSEECKTANLTKYFEKKVLQLQNQISDFFFIAPNSTELRKRCDRFIETGLSNNQSFSKLDWKYFPNAHSVIQLKESALLKASNAKKGSQLKLLLYLANNITAIFKPKWYSPHDVIEGPVYAGKDRHNGEVIAFYISVLLNFTRVPTAAIRQLNLKELLAKVDQNLLRTFIANDNKTCFYGVCSYCSRADLLCINSDHLEGSMIFHLPPEIKLKMNRHPWRRTYRCNRFANWEKNENYCVSVSLSKFYSNKINRALFLDLMDTAVFDFLIDNGDRHHYEYTKIDLIPRLLIIDNGKSFGNPLKDHIDILAPLYQCCLLRNTTWNTLLHLRGGNLSYWLRYLLNKFEKDLILDEMHYKALNRRLLTIYAVLKDCFKRKGMPNVILDD